MKTFWSFCEIEICPVIRLAEPYVTFAIVDKTIIGLFCFKPIFFVEFKKQLGRFSNLILINVNAFLKYLNGHSRGRTVGFCNVISRYDGGVAWVLRHLQLMQLRGRKSFYCFRFFGISCFFSRFQNRAFFHFWTVREYWTMKQLLLVCSRSFLFYKLLCQWVGQPRLLNTERWKVRKVRAPWNNGAG